MNNRKVKFPFLYAAIFSLVLIAFTLYVLMDTFIIKKSYISDIQNNDITQVTQEKGNVNSSDNYYSDDNITISIEQYRQYDTDIYVADITINDINYLKTAFADNTFGKNVTEKTSVTANKNNAILAINGDYYGARTKGYVIRNGISYRNNISSDSQQDLAIYSDGSFEIINEGYISTSEMLKNNVLQVFSFGPGLIDDNKITVSENSKVDRELQSNPRTAIGIIDNLHYVMVVSDGRTTKSDGLSLYQLATFMNGLNVKTAYNLDGGGSSTMVFNGKLVNNPTTHGNNISERKVSDIVYIGY